MEKVKVIKDKEVIGYCAWDNLAGHTIFNYEPEYLKKGEELSPFDMPLSEKSYFSNPRGSETFKNLPPLLADTLPDAFGNKLITEYFAQKNSSQKFLNPVEKLAFLANRGMGALEYEPAIENKREAEDITISELLNVVNAVYFKKEEETAPLNDYHQGLETLIHIGSSAGGARAKGLIAINEKTSEIKAGDIFQGKDFEYYLIKFDGLKDGKIIEPSGYGIVEYTYHQIARLSGIQMMDCKLYAENGRNHFMTKRFDRNAEGGKYHLQTVCGLTGIDFNQQGNFSYEQLHRLTLNLTNDQRQVEEMFKRMVFNIIGLNNDDHIKNFSFMIKDGKWQLTPAYDLTFAYSPTHSWLRRHSIFLNNKLTDFQLDDVLELADNFNIKKAEEIMRNTIEHFREFPSLAYKNGLNNSKNDKIMDLIEYNLKENHFLELENSLKKGKRI